MVTKTGIPAHKQMLEIIPTFAEDEDCEKVPPIRYLFRWGQHDGESKIKYQIVLMNWTLYNLFNYLFTLKFGWSVVFLSIS